MIYYPFDVRQNYTIAIVCRAYTDHFSAAVVSQSIVKMNHVRIEAWNKTTSQTMKCYGRIPCIQIVAYLFETALTLNLNQSICLARPTASLRLAETCCFQRFILMNFQPIIMVCAVDLH